MIIENITIVDFEHKEAGKYDFYPKNNIILSPDNTMGKSSLIKSIYYALGFQVKQFPNGWNHKKMVFKLDFFQGNEKYSVNRQDNLFHVSNKKEPLNEKEYSRWLQNILNIDMMLPIKQTKTLSLAYSTPVILPFYVDQDKSWSGSIYKNMADSLGAYSDIPKVIFDYILGISNDEIQELKNTLTSTKSEITNLEKQYEGISKVEHEYSESIIDVHDISPLNRKDLEVDITKYLTLLSDLNDDVNKYKAKITRIQRAIDTNKQDLHELELLLKMNKNNLKEVKSACVYCNSMLTEQQSLKRLELSNNEFEIKYLMDEIQLEIQKSEDTILKLREQKNKYTSQYESLSNRVSETKNALTVDNYLESKAKKIALDEIIKIRNRIFENISFLKGKCLEINKKIRELEKNQLERKESITKRYAELNNELSRSVSNTQIDKIEFLNFKELAGSGTEKNKNILCLYIIYMKLVSEFGRYNMPFCIDSFIKNEISPESSKEMFLIIEKYFLMMDNQTIFSMIDDNIKYLENPKEYNYIRITSRLLSKQSYDALAKDMF